MFGAASLANCLMDDMLEAKRLSDAFGLLQHGDKRVRTPVIQALVNHIHPGTKSDKIMSVDDDGHPFHIFTQQGLLQKASTMTMAPDVSAFMTDWFLPNLIQVLAGQECLEALRLLSHRDAAIRGATVNGLRKAIQNSPTSRAALLDAEVMWKIRPILEAPDDTTLHFAALLFDHMATDIAVSGGIEIIINLFRSV